MLKKLLTAVTILSSFELNATTCFLDVFSNQTGNRLESAKFETVSKQSSSHGLLLLTANTPQGAEAFLVFSPSNLLGEGYLITKVTTQYGSAEEKSGPVKSIQSASGKGAKDLGADGTKAIIRCEE